MAPRPAKLIKDCEWCGEEYEKGTGVSEDHGRGRPRLAERFCTDSCADAYNKSFDAEDDDA